MLILFDNGTPRGLARFLTGHSVEEARVRGWEELSNGELIDIAEQAGFDVVVTTDKNIRYQQNLKARRAGSALTQLSVCDPPLRFPQNPFGLQDNGTVDHLAGVRDGGATSGVGS